MVFVLLGMNDTVLLFSATFLSKIWLVGETVSIMHGSQMVNSSEKTLHFCYLS